jgi:diguanylate cyclase (GGDEF)-like protein
MRDRVYGILIAGYDSKDGITSREQGLLMQFATNAAIACENAKLHNITEELSIRDGLTGAFNHRFFQERLSQEFHRAKRYREPMALIMIDIDNFKSYNDSHGHPKGDFLLKKIVEVIQNNTRTSDILARYGGEEFAIILPSTDLRGGIVTAEKIRTIVEEYDFPGGSTQPLGRITVSTGVAAYPENVVSLPDLLECADKALYQAKNGGRNRVCHFEQIQSLEY